MTAIAGIWSFDGRDRMRECGRMLQSQQIYAPDPPVLLNSSSVVMGRRLFKLLPEDQFDRGPIVSADGQRSLVADVRLDNRAELVRALRVDLAGSRTLSDAAILMVALEQWGDEALDWIVGDFAFAYWNAEKQRLLLARDYLGQRPLHYHVGNGFFAFASMAKGLHALEEVPVDPNTSMVARFLALMPETGGDTYFRKISRVPTAHVCVATPDGVSTRQYWHPSTNQLRLPRPEEYQEAVREGLDRAVAARLRGTDGRLASHLSAGLDSSTITASAARLIGSAGKLFAFTAVPRIGYSGQEPRWRFGDEGPGAAALAAMYRQIEHVLVRSGHRSPVASLDRNFFLFERPVLNLCNGVWEDAIADEVRQRGLNVLLTGQLGNMSFSYGGMEWLPELVAQGRWMTLSRQFAGLTRYGMTKKGVLVAALGPFLPRSVWKSLSRLSGRNYDLASYTSISAAAAKSVTAEAPKLGLDLSYRPRRDPFGARLWGLRRMDTGNYLKGYLGGWGIDMRDPAADRRLVELCLAIPAEQFIADGHPRALARTAFSDRLPRQLLDERRKGLQAIDWHEGLEAAMGELALEVDRVARTGATAEVIDTAKLQRLVSEWPTGDWNQVKVMGKYRLALLRGASAGHFVRKAFGSNA